MNPYLIPGKKKATVDDIFKIVEDHTGYSREALGSPSRKKYLVLARHYFCKLAYLHTPDNLSYIGRTINRDHTTVIHSIKSLNNLLDTDKTIAGIYGEMLLKLKTQFITTDRSAAKVYVIRKPRQPQKRKTIFVKRAVPKIDLSEAKESIPQPVVRHKGVYSNPQWGEYYK